jgi:hydrogenase expression/formation protein HypD
MPEKPTTQQLIDRIGRACEELSDVSIMEVCGTHTVSLFRCGIRSLMPSSLRLISGPGCPVCVTSQGYIDAACELAGRANVTITTYGDMVRVPGQVGSLEHQRASGADIRVVYSIRDALYYAIDNPHREVVFLAVGFETTAPATAAAVLEAQQKNVKNFSVLPGHKLVIPAMMALLADDEVAVDAFLCPGHVSIIIGAEAYRPIVERHHKPCVVAGFESGQMLQGICHLVEQVTAQRAELENVYQVAVPTQGNPVANDLLDRVFEPAPTIWRAMGTIPDSGRELRDPYREFDALSRFSLAIGPDYDPPGCLCGQVIQGKVQPKECPLFASTCTPAAPVGPCMVSSEGTCSAWYKYGRADTQASPQPSETVS